MAKQRFALFVSLVAIMAFLPVAAAGATEEGCGSAFTPIYEIQGDGYSSDYKGQFKTTEGVVTVDFQDYGQLGGYFLQDPVGDGDPATSDGIWVYDYGWAVSEGDYIRITAKVDEYKGMTQLKWVDDDTAETCGSGEIEPLRLKTETYTANEEQYEGMFVTFEKKFAVTDTYNLYAYGEMWLAEDGVVEQPTNHYAPGFAEDLAEKNMSKSILLDDGSSWSYLDPPSYVPEGGTIRLGDKVEKVTGGVYQRYDYKIQPYGELTIKPRNTRPGVPKVAGDVVVGSANVLNYWTTLDGRGADEAEELEMQTDKLVAELLGLGADVLALQEIENDPDDVPIATLVAALNAEDSIGDWTWIGELDYYNTYPIRNEIVYRSGSVTPVGPPVTMEDLAFDTIRPGTSEPIGRPPVAQTFEANGRTFTVVVNHLKSKGSSCESIGDPDGTDGEGNCNGTRVWQAETVLEFVDTLIADTGDSDVLVVGDMNSYLEEDPIVTFESELANLVTKYDTDPYSYNFFAWFGFPWVGRGLLDHAFATPSMAKQVTKAVVWHINADEPHAPDWDDTGYMPEYFTPDEFGASDHDPVVIGLKLKKDK